MTTKKFPKATMESILWGDEGKIHLDSIVSTSRWSITHRLVFSPEGEEKLYETEYSTAATELQCEQPFEYQDEVECTEVEAFEKVIVDYRPVERG